MNKKICFKCKKSILSKDKFITILTTEKEKIIEAVYFHFYCHLDWLNENINRRAQEIIKTGMGQAVNLLKQLKS